MRFSISIISQGLLALLTLQAAAAPVVSTGSELQQRDPSILDTGKPILAPNFTKGKQAAALVVQAEKDRGRVFARDEPQQI
ncbi:hypothetical protein GGTG_10636 [Gaeumannomyces tritici R3-111a-1]|uniref:Uncharacterized protein n=1 Tax=Gaeumannomyces tritici (strain R3-111a-1) TaxID=644352 RepID=J3PAW1_GAET3|nr:hypothetical protein GGTG_10636 [Gaeumannomyces tritici R3-111a-1]EJT71377.1 hypothetical protein GGTG_10636 [Gaeumannomyces tritici R3-111a-1]